MKEIAITLILTLALSLTATAAKKKPAAGTPETPAAEAPAKPAVPAPDYAGHYERVGEGKTVFVLNVRQTGERVDIEFSAGNADGTGAAPDGTGTGTVNDKGELVVKIEDSFGNKGTATLRKAGNAFQITVKIDTVTDQRAMKFYGVIPLKRVDRGDR
jgi:hypothetical protein